MARDITEQIRAELDKLAARAPLLHPDHPPRLPVSNRGRRRPRAFAFIAAAAAVAIAAGAWALWPEGRQASTRVTFAPGPSGSFAPSRQMVVYEGDTLLIIDTNNNHVIRRVHLIGRPLDVGPITVAPGGIIYADVSRSTCGADRDVVRVDIATGLETVVVRNALNAALSPNGRFLAYNVGQGTNCVTGDTQVQNLATGKTKTWNITTHPGPGHAAQIITSLTWATDNRRLVLTSTGADLPSTLTQILDTDKPQSNTNPSPVGGDEAYQAPIRLTKHAMTGLVILCKNNASCPPAVTQRPEALNTINPTNGTVTKTVKLPNDAGAVLFDPSGRQVEVLTSHSATLLLQRLRNGRLTDGLRLAPIVSYGWIPNPTLTP